MIAIAVGLIGCGGYQAAPDDGAFWYQFRITGLEVEGFASISDMAQRADAVVLGHVVSVEPGRVSQGDVSEDRVYFARFTIAVDKVARGSIPGPALALELMLPQVFTDKMLGEAIGQLANSMPQSEILVFLRKKGDSNEPIFRPVSSIGFFVASPDGIEAPLSADSVDSYPGFSEELNGLRTLNDLLSYVSAAP